MPAISQHRRRALLALPAAAVLATLAGAPLAAATPVSGTAQSAPISAAPISTTQGIIMRDGGVCDPIRHMGC
jgi:hypothetical protein